MKNLFILVAVATFGSGAFAQDYKPSKGTVTTEVALTGGLGNSSVNLNNSNGLGAPSLKFRYFLKDNIGLRIGFAISRTAVKGTPSVTNEATPVAIVPPTSFSSTTTTNNSSTFLMSIGAEKHFKGSDRLSTFVGADLVFGGSKTYKEVNTTATTPTTVGTSVTITKNDITLPNRPQSVFGFGLFTGADYYIAKKVYLGIELGLQLLSQNEKDEVITTETTLTGTTTLTTTKTTAPDKNTFNFDSVMNGGIKIGYQF